MIADTSYSLVGRILHTDIYNEEGILLLGKGKILTVKDIDLLLTNNVFQIAVKDSEHTQKSIDNIAPDILEDIDIAWRYEPEMAKVYKETLSQMKRLFTDIEHGQQPNIQEIITQFSPLITHTLEHRYTLHPLHTLKSKDEYTYRHSINVGLLSAVIARLLGLTDNACIKVGEAGLFHDIGKLRIPGEILNKPGPLTEAEQTTMRQHTQIGYAMLCQLPHLSREIADAALLHHECLDGSGYPFGLKQENIPLSVQIVSVADQFDALASSRSYRPKVSPFEAAHVLWDAQFEGKVNPAIVTPFVRYIIESYVGSRVRLSNGEEGVIVRYHPQEPLRPLVRTENEKFVELTTARHVQIVEVL
jgi:putative nucleotidyltransferase with HDIG domain